MLFLRFDFGSGQKYCLVIRDLENTKKEKNTIRSVSKLFTLQSPFSHFGIKFDI